MKTKGYLTVLFVVVLSVLGLVFQVQAGLEPVQAVDQLFTAINTGEIEQAKDLFAANSIAGYSKSKQFYVGPEEIGQYLGRWHREGRTYNITQLEMAGDTVNLWVEVADRGIVWSTQHMQATVSKGIINNLEVLEIRLELR